RLTSKVVYPDGREKFIVDATGEDWIKRLWRYENTGFEPEEIAIRWERFNIIAVSQALAERDGEAISERSVRMYGIVQEMIDIEYQIGFADGVNSGRQEHLIPST
ncbi:MAG: hypothetical protein FWD39_05735, partial [Clostridiales bacterium]|nr:hypothetical protein [Clostridiales bacterium]